MRVRQFLTAACAVLLATADPVLAQTELFRCTQADGSIKFSDHGGPGCRRGEFKADVQRLDREPALAPPAVPAPGQPAVSPVAPPRAVPKKSSQPFPAATRSIPSLAVSDLPPELKAKGMSIPNKGDITLVQLAVSHLPAGDGPKFSSDAHFRGEARTALDMAAYAAAWAVQYDPKYL